MISGSGKQEEGRGLAACPIAECGGSAYEFTHRSADGGIKAYGLKCDRCGLEVLSSVPSNAMAVWGRSPRPPMDADADAELEVAYNRPIPEAARVKLEEAQSYFHEGREIHVAPADQLKVWDCLVMAKSFLLDGSAKASPTAEAKEKIRIATAAGEITGIAEALSWFLANDSEYSTDDAVAHLTTIAKLSKSIFEPPPPAEPVSAPREPSTLPPTSSHPAAPAGKEGAHWNFCRKTIDSSQPCNCIPPYARAAAPADVREAKP